ncbi:MAG TPA: hypothetical protein VN255_07775 [Mycobacterium sp.]|nr:hypothetical protein [Mycobacterium sp.]
MAGKRYLEVIKRLLSAETYFRVREEAEAREPERRVPDERPKTP